MATESELRAAAELAATWDGYIAPEDAEAFAAWKLLADAYLYEHPADDHEPATAEWLMTLEGAVRDSSAAYIEVGQFCLATLDGEWWLDSEDIWPGQTVTRGMVRRLMAALKGGG